MKPSEIMIGDWVRRRYITKPSGQEVVRDFRVAQIRRLFKDDEPDVWGDNGNMGTAEQMEPIPLTPEILEKNGFGFVKNSNTKSVWNGWWIYKGLELATACLDKKGNWPCFINIYDSNIKCEYIHQLQHALRLCGIEKEITI